MSAFAVIDRYARLTARQAQILRFIRRHVVKHGRAPTMREIARNFGIGSTNAISDHLHALARKGVLIWDWNKSRAIRLTVPAGCCAACGLPLAAEARR